MSIYVCISSTVASIVLHSYLPYFWEGTALSIHAFGRGWMLYAKLFFYHPALLCHSILLGKTTLPLFTPLGGDWFYIYIYIHIFFFQESLLSSFIALSIHAFGRGWMLHAKLFFYHPTLPCHSILLGKNYSTILPLFTPLGGDWLYIYTFIYLSFKNIFYHPSLLYRSMLLGGGGCCMSKCSFIILHCSVSHTTRTNTLPLLPPLGGDWFYIHSYIHTFLSRIFSIILHVSPSPHFWKNAIRPLIPF